MRGAWLGLALVGVACSVPAGGPAGVTAGGAGGAMAPVAPVGQLKQAACGDASTETVQVFSALAPTCAGCHSTGVRGFFGSISAFQSLVVANPALIVPGDPENSEFVKLLEARGNSGGFTQMPIGTKTYAQLLADGTATLSLDAVRTWVSGLATQARSGTPDPTASRVTRLNAEQMQRALYQQLGLQHSDFFSEAFEYGIVMAESRGDDLYPWQPPDGLPAPRQTSPGERATALGAGRAYGSKRIDTSISSTFVLTLTQVSQRWCRLAVQKQGNVALFPSGTTSATDEANVKATIKRWSMHFLGRRATDAEVSSLYSTVWVPLAQGTTPDTEAGWVGLCSTFIRSPEWIFY